MVDVSSYFDYIQTFFVRPSSVNSAPEIMLSSLNLYFKAKPTLENNASGSSDPGVTIWLCEVQTNNPVPNQIVKRSVIHLSYDRINTSQNATIATSFNWQNPIRVKTGRKYGIVIKYDDQIGRAHV